MANGLDNQHKQFIEETGLLMETAGYPRMSGRILGLLLISEKPYLSIGEITEILKASKGSISTMIRLLMQISIIERVLIPGERRDHFKVRENLWSYFIKERMLLLSEFRKHAEKGIKLVKNSSLNVKKRVKHFSNIYKFFETQCSLLLEKWQELPD
ncbi:MAG: MarR family transcriptional regulator [Spirochaetota bacterium]